MKVGTDICNPRRIKAIYKRFGDKFLNRILTSKEKDYVKSSKKLFLYRLAGRYAAKEAIAKVLGSGIGKDVSFQDIEILRNDKNAPAIKLSKGAQKLAEEQELKKWSLSISHEDIAVIAVVIAA